MSNTRPYRPPSSPTRFPVVPVAIGAVVLVLAVGLAVALAGGDGDEETVDAGGGADVELAAFGPVEVEGTALAAFTSPEADPAVGAEAPALTGEAPDGDRTEVAADGEPTLVAFLAHWCPHCQAEVPVLVDLQRSGALDGVRSVAVLTGTDESAPNFPPAEWLVEEDWEGDVLLDDEEGTAARAYGLAGYPFLVVLDGEGRVVARTSGEVPAETVVATVDAARS